MKNKRKIMTSMLGVAMVSASLINNVSADDNPFKMTKIKGYEGGVAASISPKVNQENDEMEEMRKEIMNEEIEKRKKREREGKCGEGMCGS